MLDLLITGGEVVSPDTTQSLDVAIKNGRVVALANPGTLDRDAERTIDASGLYVIPGGIDAHVHFSLDLNETMKAQSSTAGSRAAAHGGTTTFIDFAFQAGDQSLLEAIRLKRERIARERPHVDYALHSFVTGQFPFEVIEEITDAIAEGVTSAPSSPGPRDP